MGNQVSDRLGDIQLIEGIDLSTDQPRNHEHLELVTRTVENKSQETAALFLVVDSAAHQLNQSMTMVLYWSELLLLQNGSDSPLAPNLTKILKEVQYMHETVRGLDRLVHY